MNSKIGLIFFLTGLSIHDCSQPNSSYETIFTEIKPGNHLIEDSTFYMIGFKTNGKTVESLVLKRYNDEREKVYTRYIQAIQSNEHNVFPRENGEDNEDDYEDIKKEDIENKNKDEIKDESLKKANDLQAAKLENERLIKKFQKKIQKVRNQFKSLIVHEDEIMSYLENTKADFLFNHINYSPPFPNYKGCFTKSGSSAPETGLYIVEEKLDLNLGDYVFKINQWDKSVGSQLDLGLEILKSVKALHEYGVVHCNLKPSKFLRDSSKNLKITDFTHSTYADKSYCPGGTSIYAPVELWNESQRKLLREVNVAATHYKVDVFSAAVAILELMNHESYFSKEYKNFIYANQKNAAPFNDFGLKLMSGQCEKGLLTDLRFITQSENKRILDDKDSSYIKSYNNFVSSVFSRALTFDFAKRASVEEFIKGLESLKIAHAVKNMYEIFFDAMNPSEDELKKITDKNAHLLSELERLFGEVQWDYLENCRNISFINNEGNQETLSGYVNSFVRGNLLTLITQNGLIDKKELAGFIVKLKNTKKDLVI